jgi:hypothetical protein
MDEYYNSSYQDPEEGIDNFNDRAGIDNFNDRDRAGMGEREIGQTDFRDKIHGSEIDKLNERIKGDYNKLRELDLVSHSVDLKSISDLCQNIDRPDLKHAMTLAISAMILLEERVGESEYKTKIFDYINKHQIFPTSKEDIFRYYKLLTQ